MPSSEKKYPGRSPKGDVFQYPDKTAFVSVEEYDKIVKAYWNTINKYHDLATALHRDMLKGKNPGSSRRKKRQDPK